VPLLYGDKCLLIAVNFLMLNLFTYLSLYTLNPCPARVSLCFDPITGLLFCPKTLKRYKIR